MRPMYTGGGGGGGGSADWNYFRNVGTALGCGERWYCGNMVDGVATTTVAAAANTLYAVPLIEPRGGTLDRIAVYNMFGPAGNLRLGIYESTSATNLYPASIVVDGGAAAAAGGLNSRNIGTSLVASTLYWLVYLASDANAGFRSLDVEGTLPQLGVSTGFAPYTWCSVAQAYGALPAAFPGGAALLTTTPLMIGVRYSA